MLYNTGGGTRELGFQQTLYVRSRLKIVSKSSGKQLSLLFPSRTFKILSLQTKLVLPLASPWISPSTFPNFLKLACSFLSTATRSFSPILLFAMENERVPQSKRAAEILDYVVISSNLIRGTWVPALKIFRSVVVSGDGGSIMMDREFVPMERPDSAPKRAAPKLSPSS